MENYQAKFRCSFGGRIQPRIPDNKLSYVGGDTKILYVDRSIKFPAMVGELSALFKSPVSSFKYQFPGDDLDELISVTNDYDMFNMMLEYDHLHQVSPTPPRMLIFLHSNPTSRSFTSNPASAQPDPVQSNPEVDVFFSLADGARQPTAAVNPVPVTVAPPPEHLPQVAVNTSERVVVSGSNVQRVGSSGAYFQRSKISVRAGVLGSVSLLVVCSFVVVVVKTVWIDGEPVDALQHVDRPMIRRPFQRQFSTKKVAGVPVYGPTEKESRFHTPGGTSKDMASSSSQFVPFPAGKHPLFFSFSGNDSRRSFICYLHEALVGRNLEVFIDTELYKGDDILPSLFTAIENSDISIVVLSESYASSKSCLRELVKILECRKKRGQVVLPVFYNIHPSHVKKQLGSYKEAFEKHSQNDMLDSNEVQGWKDALTEVAKIRGWDSRARGYSNDLELVRNIVNDICHKLNCCHSYN